MDLDPVQRTMGNFTSFFQLAAKSFKGEKGNVNERAQKIAVDVSQLLGSFKEFDKVEAVNGYLNLFFSQGDYMQTVLDTVLEQGENFGRGERNHEQWMVEFSQPNTHKAFHVGHLRSAILGDVLARILDFAGYDVVRANYPGDMGLHVIKWLWNYMSSMPGKNPIETLPSGWDRFTQKPPAVWKRTRIMRLKCGHFTPVGINVTLRS
jgi:arginyl-tRNA synthetase